MAILQLQTAPPTGLAAVTSSVQSTQSTLPSVIYILTNDTYATVTATGYLTHTKQEGFTYSNNQMALVYTTDNGPVWLKVVITYSGANILNTVVSLVQISSPGDIILPTIANHLMVSTDTAGTLANLTGTAINDGSLQAGRSGVAGTLISFPVAAANGSFVISALNAGGAFDTTIRNSAMAQSTVYSIPDIGASTGGIVVSTTPIRTKTVFGATAAGGAAAQSFTDSFCTASSVVLGDWVTQTNPGNKLTIVPGAGSFVVTSSVDIGAGTFSYTISK